MNTLSLQIKLLEPLLIAAPASSDQNSAKSLNYIPGSVLRNAFAARYIASHQLVDAVADVTARKLFFDGICQVLNGYPLGNLGNRSLPTPRSWQADKDELAAWKTVGSGTLHTADVSNTEAELNDAKPLEISYYVETESGVELLDVSMQHLPHIVRASGASFSADDTNLFGYTAIAAGQSFCALIRTPDVETQNLWYKLIQAHHELALGASRSAGYGRVRLEVEATRPKPFETVTGDEICVTLASPAILRDAYGAFVSDLSLAFGLPAGSAVRSMNRTELVGGFNNHWALPLPQAYAVSAGSVFIFAKDKIPTATLRSAVEHGIGERREDGFGQIQIGAPHDDTFYVRKQKHNVSKLTSQLTGIDLELAQRIANHHLHAQLEDVLLKRAKRLSEKRSAPASTVARVRTAARKSIAVGSLQPVRALLVGIKGKQAERKLSELRIDGKQMTDWLKSQCDLVEKIDQTKWIDEFASGITVKQIGDISGHIGLRDRVEFTARLIDLVCRLQVRTQRRNQSKQEAR
jgi:CRISPR-associated protein Csx10